MNRIQISTMRDTYYQNEALVQTILYGRKPLKLYTRNESMKFESYNPIEIAICKQLK